MGTRNLTIVKQYGKVKVAKYCQWDGYPSGQGQTIRAFITNKLDLPLFKRQVKKLKSLSVKAVNDLWEECGADPKSAFTSMDIADKFKAKYPHLHRDMGGDILEAIQDGKVEGTFKELAFKTAWDCEWVYELDVDKETLAVYKNGTSDADYVIPFATINEGFDKVIKDHES